MSKDLKDRTMEDLNLLLNMLGVGGPDLTESMLEEEKVPTGRLISQFTIQVKCNDPDLRGLLVSTIEKALEELDLDGDIVE